MVSVIVHMRVIDIQQESLYSERYDGMVAKKDVYVWERLSLKKINCYYN